MNVRSLYQIYTHLKYILICRGDGDGNNGVVVERRHEVIMKRIAFVICDEENFNFDEKNLLLLLLLLNVNMVILFFSFAVGDDIDDDDDTR